MTPLIWHDAKTHQQYLYWRKLAALVTRAWWETQPGYTLQRGPYGRLRAKPLSLRDRDFPRRFRELLSYEDDIQAEHRQALEELLPQLEELLTQRPSLRSTDLQPLVEQHTRV